MDLLRMEQPKVEFRYEPPQRVEPIRNEPHREPFRFDQPNKPRVEHVRNEHPRNEPYRPPQNRRNRFGFHNNDRHNYGRNGHDGCRHPNLYQLILMVLGLNNDNLKSFI